MSPYHRDIDTEQLAVLQNVCKTMNEPVQKGEKITASNLFDQLRLHSRYSDQELFDFFVTDIYSYSIKPIFKEQMAQMAFDAGYHECGVWILVCNALQAALNESVTFENIQKTFHVAGNMHLLKFTTQLLQKVVKLPELLLKNQRFMATIENVPWIARIQVFLFDLCNYLEPGMKSIVMNCSTVEITQNS
jgi:hypothetical protein